MQVHAHCQLLATITFRSTVDPIMLFRPTGLQISSASVNCPGQHKNYHMHGWIAFNLKTGLGEASNYWSGKAIKITW